VCKVHCFVVGRPADTIGYGQSIEELGPV
jgi:hypothetical protein